MRVLLDSSAYSLLMRSFLDSPYSSFIEVGPVTADRYARLWPCRFRSAGHYRVAEEAG